MLVIRPVALDDLDLLLDLTKHTGFGLTTLPHDRELLRRRIRQSQHAFAQVHEAAPHGEAYLFVMEDLRTGKVVGTSGVVSKVGGFEPFYAYRIETSVHESKQLKVRKEVKTLHLVMDHNGPCEIGSLFLQPDYREGGNGRLLSLSRFLFMAEHREYFDPTVIAEMRGVLDDQGVSPFWDALGRHFFDVDYPTADYLSVVNKRFIADLMPRHPIYINLLSKDAQAVIGRVHPQTEPALRLLQEEGFQFQDMVDIFEAGPLVRCALDRIRTVCESQRVRIEDIVDETVPGVQGPELMIATTRRDMRACRAPAQVIDGGGSGGALGGLRLGGAAALCLGVRVSDTVRVATLRAAKAEPVCKDQPDVRQESFDPQPLA